MMEILQNDRQNAWLYVILVQGQLVVKRYGIKEIVDVMFILSQLLREMGLVDMLAGYFQSVH